MLKRLSLSALAGVALLGVSALAQAQNYEVTITNLTQNQVFSPILVVSHDRQLSLFQAGQPASPELATIAEGGDTGPMIENILEGNSRVLDFNTSGPVPPGMSASVTVHARYFSRVSVFSMLVNTNDAFLALNGHPVPIYRGGTGTRVPAYDAGSELNTELCADIPGPACPPESGNANSEGEGFIHIHNGIHGVGDLEPALYDWRNPVASISVKRVR